MALIKWEILTSRKSVIVLQKDAFQNMDFSRLKCQLKRKNWHTFFVTIFQVSADEGMGNKVNLLSF